MTIADKIAELPEMPDIEAAKWPTGMQPDDWWTYWEETSDALTARLALLLETVRAYTEASDFLNSRVESDERAGAYHENRAEIEALNMAYADLRTLQAHLEGERI